MGSRSVMRADKAFAAVYSRNIRRVYQICFLYLKNRHDAEDAAQAVFEKYLGVRKLFRDNNHEKAWFIAVTRNYCRDQLKRFWKRRRVDMAEIGEIAAGPDCTDNGLTEALLCLPAKYKDALYLYYIEGYSVRETARLLHRNESTLRNHLSEGRALLKIDLGGYYDD